MNKCHVYSSVRGKLDLLFAVITGEGDLWQFSRLGGLLSVVPESTRLLIWCNQLKGAKSFQNYLKIHGWTKGVILAPLNTPISETFKCLIIYPTDGWMFFTSWVRDPMIFIQEDVKAVRVISAQGQSLDDQGWIKKVFSKILLSPTLTIKKSGQKFPVAGGNFLADDQFVFVGAHQFRKSIGARSENSVITDMLDELDGTDSIRRKVIRVGNTTHFEPEVLMHIDLYLNLTGTKHLVTGKYQVMLAFPIIIQKELISNPRVQKKLQALITYLELIKKELEMEGFEVINIPLPLLFDNSYGNPKLCSYHNGLFSVHENGNWAYLPRYSFNKEKEAWYSMLVQIEAEIELKWEKLGFTLGWVNADFHKIIDQNGSLHCITQEILRI